MVFYSFNKFLLVNKNIVVFNRKRLVMFFYKYSLFRLSIMEKSTSSFFVKNVQKPQSFVIVFNFKLRENL